jgi:hypothetical protein
MTHLEVENLASDYLEGLLDPASRAAVETHLVDCFACRELLSDVLHMLGYCRSAEQVQPAPWLVSRILLATTGARRPTLLEQFAAWFRPALQPRVAYSLAMAVFAFSVIVNSAGFNLRELRVDDLNPRTWYSRANRSGHLMYARAEKFYYDLRVVYLIESRIQELRSQPQDREEEAPKPAAPPGGSSQDTPSSRTQLASNGRPGFVASPGEADTVAGIYHTRPAEAGRSPIP